MKSINLLVISVSPEDQARLDALRELDEIECGIKGVPHGYVNGVNARIVSETDVTLFEFPNAFARCQPKARIAHLSAHATKEGLFALKHERSNEAELIKPEVMANYLIRQSRSVSIIFISACCCETLALLLRSCFPVVVYFPDEIQDHKASRIAKYFYRELLQGSNLSVVKSELRNICQQEGVPTARYAVMLCHDETLTIHDLLKKKSTLKNANKNKDADALLTQIELCLRDEPGAQNANTLRRVWMFLFFNTGALLIRTVIRNMRKGRSTIFRILLPPEAAANLLAKWNAKTCQGVPGIDVTHIGLVERQTESEENQIELELEDILDNDEAHLFLATNYLNDVPAPQSVFRNQFRLAADLFLTCVSNTSTEFKASLAHFHFLPITLASSSLERFPHELSTVRNLAVNQALRFVLPTWVIFTFIVSFALASVFTFPQSNISEGLSIALLSAFFASMMGVSGGTVCGPLFNVLGVAVGGATFGIMFGLMQSLLVLHLSHVHIADLTTTGVQRLADLAGMADPFSGTVLGIIGVSAAYISPWLLPTVLALPSIAIGASAWLMGNPRSDEPSHEHPIRIRLPDILSYYHLDDSEITGEEKKADATQLGIVIYAFIGFFVGFSGIGAVKVLTLGFDHFATTMSEKHFAFCAAATVIGSICYTLCVWLRVLDWRRAAKWGVGYGLVGFSLWFLTAMLKGSLPGLFINQLGTAFFHACFFTLSYAVGFVLGGRRAAFWAAAAEGIVGFVLFNVLNFFKLL